MRATCLVLAPLVVFCAIQPARAEDGCVLEPAKLRFEDRFVCPPEAMDREAFPDALKDMPMNSQETFVLSLGGEIRQRYEYTDDPLFGEAAQSETGVWLQRYTLHGDFRIGPHIRIFAQLSSALEAGRGGGPSPVDKNTLALQNGFVELPIPFGPDTSLTLRGGRQELQFGSGRLVDVREGPNVRRTFDAVSARLDRPDWRIESLLARPIETQPGVFDDQASDERLLWGVYATRSAVSTLPGAIEIYYLGFEDESGTFAQGSAREVRHSVGTRLSGVKAGWDWNWEATWQFGTFGAGRISAWTMASETGFTFREAPWQPRFAISANIASGDSDPDDPDLGTFNAIFPRGNYFSQDGVLGPRNFFNLHPFVTVKPAQDWSLTADMNLFWRLETRDGVYSPAGQLVRAPSGSDERFVGSAISLTSSVGLAENLSFTAIYTHFFAGDFIRATGPSQDIDFVEFTLQTRF
jgi:Alginate export